MSRLKIIAVGNKLPGWINEGFLFYQKRFPKDCAVELIEIPAVKRFKNSDPKVAILKEGQMLLEKAAGCYVVILDLKGVHFDTKQLSQKLSSWQGLGKDICFLIGGPEGLSDACKQQANESWCLSNLTFPHSLARVVVAESLYRAWSLQTNHPYHRE